MRMARPAEKHYRGNSVKAGSAVFKVGFWVLGVLLQSVVVFLFHSMFSCPCVCTSVEELLGPGLPGLCVSNPKPNSNHHHLPLVPAVPFHLHGKPYRPTQRNPPCPPSALDKTGRPCKTTLESHTHTHTHGCFVAPPKPSVLPQHSLL